MTVPLTLVQHASSTNDLVLEEPFISQPPPFAVGTFDQRAGRGRQNRTWVNRPGESLALTVVITPRLPRELWGWYPLLTALAAVDALTAVIKAQPAADSEAAPVADSAAEPVSEPAIRIKWPNDLLTPDGRKLAGILCSAHAGGAGRVTPGDPGHQERLAIGIGINLGGNMNRADPLLAGAATLTELMTDTRTGGSAGPKDLGPAVARAVTDTVLNRVEQAESSTESFHALCKDYGEKCITVGRVVTVIRDGEQEELTGTATGIDPLGQLIIRCSDSSETSLSSGDVHFTPAPPSGAAERSRGAMNSAEPLEGMDESVPTTTAEMTVPQQLNKRFARIRQSVGALERALLHGPRKYSRRDLEQIQGIPKTLSAQYWRGMGFGGIDHDTAVFTDEDAEAIGDLSALVEEGAISEETFVTFARGFGFHMGRLAMWVTEALVDEAKAGGKLSDSQARMLMLERTPELIDTFEQQVLYAFRRQLASYTARAGSEILRSVGDDWADEAMPLPRAIAFADLVQFTRLAQSVDGFELADVIKDFEGACRDIISEGGGRVVKTVGDEIMFLADTPEDGVRIALSIAESIETNPELPKVRVGLAWGHMFSRYGDVFGPKVNLAARLQGIAQPGAVVVDGDTADAIDRSFPGGFTRKAEWTVELAGIGEVLAVELERAAASLIEVGG